jgi:cell division protein ZapA
MTTKTMNATIDLLGKSYSIRCPESELKSLQQASDYLNKKMLEIQEAGTAINLERIAIMAGLNIAYELLQQDHYKSSIMNKINQKISNLHDRLDIAVNRALQRELIYTTE